MKTSILNEMAHTLLVNMEWNALRRYQNIVNGNIASMVELETLSKRTGALLCMKPTETATLEKLYVDDAEWLDRWGEVESDDMVINAMYVNGPVLREGGGCAYGSKEHRDQMMYAASMKQCIGHIFYINTPGGTSFAKNDYRMGIEAARAAGQPVIALIDGLCASAGYALAAQCDEVYFVQPEAEIGCIGTYAAGYISKNGDVNAITQDRYFEIYDPASSDKNIEFRKLAEGDESMVEELVKEDGEAFRAMVRANRPYVPEEMIHGKLYKGSDTVGTLTDGQSSENEVIERILGLHDGSLTLLHGSVEEPEVNPEGNEPQVKVEEPEKPEDEPVEDPEREPDSKNQTSHKFFTEMKEFPHMNAAMGLNVPFEADENGAYFSEEFCEKLEAAIASGKQAKSQLDAKMTEIAKLNEEIDNLKAANEQALSAKAEEFEKTLADKEAELNAAHQEELDNLNTANEQAMSEVNASLDAATNANEDLKKQVEELQGKVAEQQKEIEEMAAEPAKQPQTPSAQGNNVGQQAEECQNLIYKEGMTAQEKREALEKRMRQLKGARV